MAAHDIDVLLWALVASFSLGLLGPLILRVFELARGDPTAAKDPSISWAVSPFVTWGWLSCFAATAAWMALRAPWWGALLGAFIYLGAHIAVSGNPSRMAKITRWRWPLLAAMVAGSAIPWAAKLIVK